METIFWFNIKKVNCLIIPSISRFDRNLNVFTCVFITWLLLITSRSEAGILNGSFTDGSANWITTLNFHCTNSGQSNYRTAPGYAWFANSDGSPASSIEGTLTQSFAVPAMSFTSDISIEFYTLITTEEILNISYDFMYCTITDGTTKETSQIVVSNLDKSDEYIKRNIPIPANMAGHTLTLTFYAKNDNRRPTVFRIDDVSFVVRVISTVGDISVSVKNVSDGNQSVPGVNGLVQLFNSSNSLIKEDYTSGGVTFSNVTAGTGYYYRVYHEPPNTFYGSEYWGTQTGISVIANQTTYYNFTRNQPYVASVKVFNGATDVTGKSVEPNTQLRVEQVIKNPPGANRYVQGQVIADIDKSSLYDFPLGWKDAVLISADGTYTNTWNITTSSTQGNYYYTTGVKTLYNGSYVVSDGWEWSESPLFSVASTVGVLSVTLKNVEDGNQSVPGANGKILLYDSNYQYFNKYQITNSSGVASFLNLVYGNYFLEAYHIPSNPSTIFGEEFWGSIGLSHRDISNQLTFTRNMPYVNSYKIINELTGKDITGGSTTVGTPLRIDIKVKNPGTSIRKVKVRLVLDRDKTNIYDRDVTSTEYTIPAKSGTLAGEITIGFPYAPPSAGDYFGVYGTMTNTTSTNYPYTDGSAWENSKWLIVTSSIQVGDLNVSVKNVPGASSLLPGTNGVVELYSSENSLIASKNTDYLGSVTFFNIPEGKGYYYKVFNALKSNLEKEFWGTNSDITIAAKQLTKSTFTRNQPYSVDVRIFNGNMDVTGQTVEPFTNLTIKYTVHNPSSNFISAKSNIYLDESKLYPWDYTLRGQLQLIPPNESITQNIPFTPSEGGTFYAAGLVNIEAYSLTGTILYTDNKTWGDSPLLRVLPPNESTNIWDAFVNLANNRRDKYGNLIDPLDILYKKNGEKEFLFLKGGLEKKGITMEVELYIDLADIYSYLMEQKGLTDKIISEEGRKGWVTLWINGKLGAGLGFDSWIGITPPAKVDDDQKDPTMKFNFDGPNIGLPFLNINSVESNMDGESWGQITKTSTIDLDLTFIELEFNIYRFEVNIKTLSNLLKETFKLSLSNGSVTPLSVNFLLSEMLDFKDSKLVPSSALEVLNEPSAPLFRPFSSTDNNKVGVDGVLNFLNGGIDENNDRKKDNTYPVIPKTWLGLSLPSNQAELTFQNTGEETADFYIKVKKIPDGWVVGSNYYDDHKGSYISNSLPDLKYPFPNAPKSEWNNFFYTFWTIGCVDAENAKDAENITFELWHNKSGFDKLLQEKTLTVYKQKPKTGENNEKPSISDLKASDVNGNTTKDVEISWNASDPDDDAIIDIAIGSFALGDKPWETGGYTWIATNIHENSNKTFLWNFSGVATGEYCLWAVIYDGKNPPQYIKSYTHISISSLIDKENPWVVIDTPKSIWENFNLNRVVHFFDNLGLNNESYQFKPQNGLTKSSELVDTAWHPLTKDGMFILPESQNNLSDKMTTDWKVSNHDWDSLSLKMLNGEKQFLYLKVTDDAGNTTITKDETGALEIKIDIAKPHLSVNYPTNGQRLDANSVKVEWMADDITNGIELSGLDSICIALDQADHFLDLNGTETNYTFKNLSDGIHKVFLKAKELSINKCHKLGEII